MAQQAELDRLFGVGEPWVVVLVDPQTGEIESYGPYSRDQALRVRYWCTAELDLDDLGDVEVFVAPCAVRP